MEKRYPKNHFLSIGIAIGIPLGIPLGLLIGNVSLGPLLGVVVGIPIGLYLEKRHNPNPRPLTVEEEYRLKRNTRIALFAGVAMFALGTTFYFIH